MVKPSFGTVLTCMDGRIQRPVNDFLVTRFGVANIDTITRAGIVKHLTTAYDPATKPIIDDLETSLNVHQSSQIALVAHNQCAGNPVLDSVQRSQLQEAVEHFRRRYPQLAIMGLWVGEQWTVEAL